MTEVVLLYYDDTIYEMEDYVLDIHGGVKRAINCGVIAILRKDKFLELHNLTPEQYNHWLNNGDEEDTT